MEIPPEDYRVSDRDREAFAARLAQGFQDGRLDVDEYEARLAQVYAAKTFRDLIPHTLDLPERDFTPGAVPARPFAAPTGAAARPFTGQVPLALRVLWIIWASIVAVNLVVYGIVVGITGSHLYPWPLWVALPTGAVLGVVHVGVRPLYKHPRLPKRPQPPQLP